MSTHHLVYVNGVLKSGHGNPAMSRSVPDYTIDAQGQPTLRERVARGDLVQVLHFVDGRLTKRACAWTGAAAGEAIAIDFTEEVG